MRLLRSVVFLDTLRSCRAPAKPQAAVLPTSKEVALPTVCTDPQGSKRSRSQLSQEVHVQVLKAPEDL